MNNEDRTFIPLWFSLNWNATKTKMAELGFPYHYGSHSTELEVAARLLYKAFPYHYGSHSTWSQGRGMNLPSVVSIPLWFSLNKDVAVWLPIYMLFPYHYGSHSTNTVCAEMTKKLKFPYHYGSHSTSRRKSSYRSRESVSIPLWFSLNVRDCV